MGILSIHLSLAYSSPVQTRPDVCLLKKKERERKGGGGVIGQKGPGVRDVCQTKDENPGSGALLPAMLLTMIRPPFRCNPGYSRSLSSLELLLYDPVPPAPDDPLLPLPPLLLPATPPLLTFSDDKYDGGGGTIPLTVLIRGLGPCWCC